MTLTAALALLALFLFLAVLWLLILKSRCYLCRTRAARVDVGDYPICLECYERLESQRRRMDAISDDTADEAIREYFREHPEK